MTNKPMKVPGPEHPIDITPTKGRVTVNVNGILIAHTREALTLKEAAYPPVQYIHAASQPAPGNSSSLNGRESHFPFPPPHRDRQVVLIQRLSVFPFQLSKKLRPL